MKYTLIFLMFISSLLLSTSALAQEENTENQGETGLGAALRGLKWGVNHQEVLKF